MGNTSILKVGACLLQSGTRMRLPPVRKSQWGQLTMSGSHLGLHRVVLSRCDSTGHSRWHTKSVVMGGTGREIIANQLQPVEQLLHQHVHHFRCVTFIELANTRYSG